MLAHATPRAQPEHGNLNYATTTINTSHLMSRVSLLQSAALKTQHTVCLRTEPKRVGNTIPYNPHNLVLAHYQRHVWTLYTRDLTIDKKVLKLFRPRRSKRIKSVTGLSKPYIERAYSTIEVKQSPLWAYSINVPRFLNDISNQTDIEGSDMNLSRHRQHKNTGYG
jgi:hypothetical protein